MELEPRLYAYRLGIDMNEEYGANEAAMLCRVGVNRLRDAKTNGELEYISVGKKRYKFLGVDLIKWKLSKKRIDAESTTSHSTGKAIGVVHGMTSRPDKENLQASALEMFS